MEPRPRGCERGRAVLVVAASNRPAEGLHIPGEARSDDGGAELPRRRRAGRRLGRDGFSLRLLGRRWCLRTGEVAGAGAPSLQSSFGRQCAERQMSAVTAKRPLRESFISSGELLRRDVAGPMSVPVTVEENVVRATLRLFSTCSEPAGHFGPMTLRLRLLAASCPSWARGLLSAQWELWSPWTCPLPA